MGEYADEAIQNGLCEEFRGKEPLFQFYNNSIWVDVSGKNRKINEMDSLHLCFVMNYILSGYCKIRGNSVYLMGRTLVNRGYRHRNLLYDLESLKVGSYQMYSNDVDVVSYYRKLILKYKDYDWSPLIQYMMWR